MHWDRVILFGVAIVLTIVGVVVLVTRGSGQQAAVSSHRDPPPASTGVPATTTSTTVPATTTTTTAPPSTTTTTGAGSLPQTGDFPSTATPQFTAEIEALWNGIVSNSVATAMPAFFPEAAYLQLKTIGGAQSDFENRLVGDYGLDIGAAHALLGADAAQAQFAGVSVPASYGHWVSPGVCDNDVGYFEVPNSRVLYQEDGQTRSFGIASMISWRGQWYVVHLGAVLPSGSQGEVDDPETGPGSSAPSSTC
ncbi:MAG: hypothetical protein WB765_09625 [Acidimicrobiales bacterium]